MVAGSSLGRGVLLRNTSSPYRVSLQPNRESDISPKCSLLTPILPILVFFYRFRTPVAIRILVFGVIVSVG